MNKVSLIMPYYMNPTMLVKQFEVWRDYPEHIKGQLEVVIVDDASPMGHRAEDVIKKYKLSAGAITFHLYRVLIDLRWNQHGARNIGAKEAKGDWLLLTDIDHIITKDLMTYLVETELERKHFYMFDRMVYTDKELKGLEHKDPHPNSYFLIKKLYWKAGGYDETFCGHYGTDGHFNRQLKAISSQVQIKKPLHLVGRSSIPDASTTTLQRKEGRDPMLTKDIEEFKRIHNITVRTLRLPWKKII